MPFNTRRYLVHFGGAMAAYTVVLMLSVVALDRYELSVPAAAAVALAPVVPVLYALHAFIVAFREADEFHRRVISEAIIWAAGLVGFVSFAWGFLEVAIEVPAIPYIWVLPALIGTYGVAQCILYWRLK
jgi:threonine dehydrogenase-like Zn-dependent dehydrogenase